MRCGRALPCLPSRGYDKVVEAAERRWARGVATWFVSAGRCKRRRRTKLVNGRAMRAPAAEQVAAAGGKGRAPPAV